MRQLHPGDVVIANNEPGLVITINSHYGIIIRRFRFTQGGQFRGIFDYSYPRENLSLANAQQTNSVKEDALKALRFKQAAIPKKIYDQWRLQLVENYIFAFFFPTSTGKIAWSGETAESLPNRGNNSQEKQEIIDFINRSKAGDFMFLDHQSTLIIRQRD